MSTVTEVGSLYSSSVGFVYVFNLIVGAGVLAMPKAFGDVGWALGISLLCVLAFMSYVTSTMMVEAMAAANAVLCIRRRKKLAQEQAAPTERSRLLPYAAAHEKNMLTLSDSGGINADTDDAADAAKSVYNITDRVEMGTMAKLFFNKIGITLYYLCICIYLYGDLAIYAVAIPKALVNVTCWRPVPSNHSSSNWTNATGNVTDDLYSYYDSDDMYEEYSLAESDDLQVHHANRSKTAHYCFGEITDHRAYWIFLGLFALVLGPFTFFDLQKTKVLQLATTVLRWLAFITMVALAGKHISQHGTVTLPHAADIKAVPSMFGVAVYSFMCQHSLPSLVTPINNKRRLSFVLLGDFVLVLMFYALVNFTAILAFPQTDLEDEYSNNFNSIIAPEVISYFLRLFPVFVLSTNFPIISITLRNNLKSLFLDPNKSYSFSVERLVFPIAALLPPFIIAFATQNLEKLVGYTGSYAGVGVQYLIPVALVFCARRQLPAVTGGVYRNIHKSPFFHRSWLIFVAVWSAACITFNTVNHILNG